MNPSPFSLDNPFRAEDATEDKIDVELGKWRVFGLVDDDDATAFKSYLSSPPDGQEDFAWPSESLPAWHGAFLCRAQRGGRDTRLWLRKEAVIHPEDSRRIEPPLCGGYCRFHSAKPRLPVTGDSFHYASLRLSLNLQRFIRHQPQQDDPRKPWRYRLQRRKGKQSVHAEEASLDGEDNWLPDTPDWQKFSAKEHLGMYLELIADQMGDELIRACHVYNQAVLLIDEEEAADDWSVVRAKVAWEREEEYRLRQVETLWEFPSTNPIAEVWELGKKMMHLSKKGGTAKVQEMEIKEAGRVLNSPCFSIPLAEGVRVKLYAKTNKRIRFEIVQSNLGNDRAALFIEAGISPKEGRRSWDELPLLLKAIRERAAKHMNKLMEKLRAVEQPGLRSKGLIELLAEVAAAVPASISKQTRVERIQTVLNLLCFQKGYGGGIDKGPCSDAFRTLAERKVIHFDPTWRRYALTDAYKPAAEALAAVAGDPLFAAFGPNASKLRVPKSRKPPVRLRE